MFSVIIPVYNHRPYVVQGILSALRSGLVGEVLLLDDGSRDGSPELLRQLAQPGEEGRIRNLTPSEGGNRGAHNRLNELVEAARFPWIAVLNSDDAFLPERFATVALHVRRTEIDFVCGHLLIMDAQDRPLGRKRGPLDPEFAFPGGLEVAALLERSELLPLLACQNFIATTSNMMFTKALHGRIGGFADYRYVHDWDFALRAAAIGRPLYLPSYLTCYRVHNSNTISEDGSKVKAEVGRVFSRFQADFPDLAARPDLRLAMAHNRYLAGAGAEVSAEGPA